MHCLYSIGNVGIKVREGISGWSCNSGQAIAWPLQLLAHLADLWQVHMNTVPSNFLTLYTMLAKTARGQKLGPCPDIPSLTLMYNT